MRNVLTVAGRELNAYFASPMAYVITAGFLVITGIIFAVGAVQARDGSMRGVLSSMSIVFLLITPIIAMRLIAEEERQGTIELLLTAPLRDAEVVIGKYLGALALLLIMIAFTLYYVVLLMIFGNPDLGAIAAGYIGVILLGASFLAIGIFASSLTQNQIVAALIAFAIGLTLWFISALAFNVPRDMSSVVQYLGLSEHFFDFIRGVVDTRHIVYYLSAIVALVFLTVRSVESRRWR